MAWDYRENARALVWAHLDDAVEAAIDQEWDQVNAHALQSIARSLALLATADQASNA